MPSNLLITLVVESFNYSICRLAKTYDCEVSGPIEHIVIVGPPFVTMNYVLLRLVAFKLFIACITSEVIFEGFCALGFYVFNDDKPTTVVVSEFDW